MFSLMVATTTGADGRRIEGAEVRGLTADRNNNPDCHPQIGYNLRSTRTNQAASAMNPSEPDNRRNPKSRTAVGPDAAYSGSAGGGWRCRWAARTPGAGSFGNPPHPRSRSTAH